MPPPLNQHDPPDKISLITGDPYSFVNTVKYCHHYPDIMCYERTGNGWTAGDEAAWTVSSCTDSSGLGSVRILFPYPADSEAAGEHNGLFHARNSGLVLGSHVTISCFNGYVRFYPGGTIDFYAYVPFERWPGSLFVRFKGPANSRFFFAFFRRVIWAGQPPPYIPPDNDPDHDEL